MLMLIDNYDSFTFNLYQYLCELGAEVEVVRNDQTTLAAIEARLPGIERIVISPGPCTPYEAGLSVPIVQHFGGRVVISGSESGMHVLVNLAEVRDADAFVKQARERRVGIYHARPYFLTEPPPGATFLMGYSSVTVDGIREGIGILAEVAR